MSDYDNTYTGAIFPNVQADGSLAPKGQVELPGGVKATITKNEAGHYAVYVGRGAVGTLQLERMERPVSNLTHQATLTLDSKKPVHLVGFAANHQTYGAYLQLRPDQRQGVTKASHKDVMAL